MPLASLGACGPTVSRLGLGLAALGRPGYMNLGHAEDLGGDYDVAAMRDHTAAVLDAAWRAGVRYFDTARSYGRAEEFLGHWLRSRGVPVDGVTVGSKWGYTYTANWRVDADTHEVKEHSLAVLQRQIAESRAQLGEYLGVYHIHSATPESGVLENRPVLDALSRLRAGGLSIGLTTSGPSQADTIGRALELRVDGAPLFSVVQSTWNAFEPSVAPALCAARALGLGVIVKEALANGRLTSRGAPALPHAVARRLGVGVDALALAHALRQPWAHVVLSGAARADHLRANLAALRVELDGQAVAELEAAAEEPEAYWRRRSALPWN